MWLRAVYHSHTFSRITTDTCKLLFLFNHLEVGRANDVIMKVATEELGSSATKQLCLTTHPTQKVHTVETETQH